MSSLGRRSSTRKRSARCMRNIGRRTRMNAGDVLTIDRFAVKELKTKAFVEMLKKQTDARKVLVLSDAFDDTTYKSARNVKPVLLATANNVNTEQLLAFDKILVTSSAL